MWRADVLVKELGTVRKATFGRTRYGKKNGQTGRSSDPVPKMFGLCVIENGIEIDELLQARGLRRAWRDVSETAGSCQRGLTKRKDYWKGSRRLE